MINCTSCGQENPEGARFCNACGAPLGADTDTGREVRKTVTVVFCDVVGSTELGERFDPEVLRDMMARFYAAVREPVEHHGGTVEKVIGDALVAVFGIPVVREDDALRAVRAALEMRDAVRAMGDVKARIGVNTGDVLARDATRLESLVVGDAVNVAARLEQAAAAGEVLVGGATWALVGHAARGERVAPVAAKGKREPLEAWRLESVDPNAGGHRRRLDLPMVGRTAELDLLRWALGRTEQLHRPHLVLVLGQPGIGKSRLTSELTRLGEGLAPLTGQCRATTGASSLEPLLEVVRAALPGGRTVAQGVAGLMPGDPDAPAVASCLTRGAGAGAPDVAWAAARLIGALAAARATVVVLEDVHWADDLLLDVIEQMLGHSRRQSLLVVCTARPELTERRPGWGMGANVMSISLERLDDTETRRLLTHAVPGLLPDQAEQIVATAEGNPLFAEHLAALMEDHDGPAGLPRSIQVLLTARLEALPESEREVVGVASVAGREFPVVAVEALVARPVVVELDHLGQRELIEPTTPGRWQFGHALLQEAAYGLLPKQRRSELHVRLARWLADQGAGDALVGDHLERAFRLRSELGQTDGETAGLAEDAGMRLAAAGVRADAAGDPRRARALLERALDLLSEDSPRYAAAMVELAAAGWNLLTKAELQRLLETGAERAAAHRLRALELRARMLTLGFGTDDDLATQVAIIEAALSELEHLDDPRALATTLCTLADSACTAGQAAASLPYVRRAIDVLRTVDEDMVWAIVTLRWAMIESPMPVASASAELAGLRDEMGMRPTLRSELLVGQAALSLLGGREDEAWSLFEAASELEYDLRPESVWRLANHRAEMLLWAGQFEQARPVLAEYVAELEHRRVRWAVDVARSHLGLAEVRLGVLDEAAAHARAGQRGGYEGRARAHQVLCEVHLARGELDHALREARAGVAVVSAGDWVLLEAEVRLTAARALIAAGDLGTARAQAGASAGLCRAKGYVRGAEQAQAVLASLDVSPG